MAKIVAKFTGQLKYLLSALQALTGEYLEHEEEWWGIYLWVKRN